MPRFKRHREFPKTFTYKGHVEIIEEEHERNKEQQFLTVPRPHTLYVIEDKIDCGERGEVKAEIHDDQKYER
ncbi:MAG: hypothetical protein Fur0010_01400 [Bdellovibrio sp.]